MLSRVLIGFFLVWMPLAGVEYSRQFDKAIGRITKDFSRDLSLNEGLCLLGSGGGMGTGVNKFIYHYEGHHSLDVCAARALLLRCSSNLLDRLNSSKAISKYGPGYPYSMENIELMISFAGPDGWFPGEARIALVSLHKSVVRYSIYDSDADSLITVHRESLDEARNLVREK